MYSHIFETYKNNMMPHGRHIHQTEFDMAMATMCTYPLTQHALQHWKYMFHLCLRCTHIAILSKESDNDHLKTCPTIRLYIYIMVS